MTYIDKKENNINRWEREEERGAKRTEEIKGEIFKRKKMKEKRVNEK